MPADVVVKVEPLNIKIDTTQPMALITKMANEVRHGDADGITRYAVGYRYNALSNPPEVTFYGIDVNILLAKELAPTSCRYSAVMDHEFRHINTLERVMSSSAKHLQESLKGTHPSPDELSAKVAAAVKDLLATLDDAQDKVDSAQEAERLDHYCHHNLSTGIITALQDGLVTYAPDTSIYAQPPRLKKLLQLNDPTRENATPK